MVVQERHLSVGDDNGEWSYSTAPGIQTMELLQERFGKASFSVGSWQHWELEGEALATGKAWSHSDQQLAGPATQFRLASPKFQLEAAHGRSQEHKQVRGLALGLSLMEFGRCPNQHQGEAMRLADSGPQWMPPRLASPPLAQQ